MNKKELYTHQQNAVDDATAEARSGNKAFYLNCCVSFGKSLVIAHIANMVLAKGNRCLILTPSEELCGQNFNEAFHYIDNPSDLGIVCSGLNKTQLNKKCVVATYQSFLSKRAVSGEFAVVLHDEAHGMSNNPDTSIRKIIKSLQRLNPNLITIGFTGSPFRMSGQGLLENDNQEGKAFYNKCVYESDISEMIRLGYLSHMESISGDVQVDLSGKEFNNGISTDYNTKLVSVKFNEILEPCVMDMKVKFIAHNVQTAAIFASSVENASRIVEEWDNDNEIKILHGGMIGSDRKRILDWIKNGTGNRYIVNVGILTTGWNFPALDCVALLMATKSLSKYIQCCGRAIRAYTCEKGIEKIGLIYDAGGNIERHGALDNLNIPKNSKGRGDMPKKICGLCETANILSAKHCKECGAKFISEDDKGNFSMRSKAQILQDKQDKKTTTHEVGSVSFEIATSRKNEVKMIKMIFWSEDYDNLYNHYLCLNHSGQAQAISKRFLLRMFKNHKDYYQVGAVGLSVENMFNLLSGEHYDNFFKSVESIQVRPQSGNARFNELKSIKFKV